MKEKQKQDTAKQASTKFYIVTYEYNTSTLTAMVLAGSANAAELEFIHTLPNEGDTHTRILSVTDATDVINEALAYNQPVIFNPALVPILAIEQALRAKPEAVARQVQPDSAPQAQAQEVQA